MKASLFGTRWIHAFEEDTADHEVYRPETDDIPPSRRPRRRLRLSPDGSAEVGMPGPDDRPVDAHATWKQDGEDVVIRAGKPGADHVLRIAMQSPTRLVVKK